MKKSQRLRLAALLGQASLTQAEAAELAQLNALASQHPDAARDTDDTAPAAAAPVVAPAAAPAAAAPVTTPAAAPAATPFAGLLATIGAGFRSRAGLSTELTTARASIVALTRERDEARAALAPEQTARAGLTAQLAAVCAFFGVKPESLAGQTADQLRATFETAIQTAANAQLASMGVSAVTLPAPTAAGGESLEDVQAALAKEKDPVKAGLLAAKANKLLAAAQSSAGKN